MNPSSDTPAARSSLSTVLAACIVAAGLIAAALIVAHKPTATAIVSAKPATAPPITQESARDQFRAQVMAAPGMHIWPHEKVVYTLQDVKVQNVIYSAKDDTYTILYDLTFQPTPPNGWEDKNVCTLNNDGYNHYYGDATFNPQQDASGISAPITLK